VRPAADKALEEPALRTSLWPTGNVTIVNEAGHTSKESLIINRDDFWTTWSSGVNEQGQSLELPKGTLPTDAAERDTS